MGIIEIVGAVLGSTALSTLISSLLNRRKVQAEASVAVVEVTLKWAASLANRIEHLEKQLCERDEMIAELRERIAVLEAQAEEGWSLRRKEPPSGTPL